MNDKHKFKLTTAAVLCQLGKHNVLTDICLNAKEGCVLTLTGFLATCDFRNLVGTDIKHSFCQTGE